MKILLIWLCASSAMDDCKVFPISEPQPSAQCETAKQEKAQVLGTGPDQNYRLECQDA